MVRVKLNYIKYLVSQKEIREYEMRYFKYAYILNGTFGIFIIIFRNYISSFFTMNLEI